MRDALPTERQRVLLHEIVSDALVEIRHLCGLGLAKQAGDLADVMHELPKEIYGWGGWSWESTEQAAARYKSRWSGSESSPLFDYAARIASIRASS